jgi:hypothetical protein
MGKEKKNYPMKSTRHLLTSTSGGIYCLLKRNFDVFCVSCHVSDMGLLARCTRAQKSTCSRKSKPPAESGKKFEPRHFLISTQKEERSRKRAKMKKLSAMLAGKWENADVSMLV